MAKLGSIVLNITVDTARFEMGLTRARKILAELADYDYGEQLNQEYHSRWWERGEEEPALTVDVNAPEWWQVDDEPPYAISP